MKRLTVDQIKSLAASYVAGEESPEKLSSVQNTMILMFTEFGVACMYLAEQQT
jgi:hypothetical protein